jgi:hypothetical protein
MYGEDDILGGIGRCEADGERFAKSGMRGMNIGDGIFGAVEIQSGSQVSL